MIKRILCLLLCLVMLVGCLASCGTKEDEEAVEDINEEASESALTLSMYLMSENQISTEQADAIEAAVNRITKAKFKTQLELSFFTADEYYEKLEAAFAARAEAEAAGLIKEPVSEDESTEEETFENEWGVSEIKYPTIDGFQVDIFYMGGYDRFVKYLDMGMLSNLNDEVSSASKKLSSYIAKPYLDYMKSINNKSIYAIPTNAPIGEYTYLLVNKKALEKTHYDTDAGLKYFTGLTNEGVQGFLSSVKDYGYTPLYFDNTKYDYVELASAGIQYWGVDANGELSEEFSLLASNIGDGQYFSTMSTVSSTSFATNLGIITEYANKDYFGTADQLAKGEVAVAYVKGGAEIPDAYGELYEAVVIEKPMMRTADVYKNMFAVTTYTTSLSRSMEIVTYLNTNEDLRNILLYGIEDENYELVPTDFEDENGEPLKDADGNVYKVVRRLNDSYIMDPNKTGNTLITYTLEGEDPTLKEYVKKQNQEYVASPLIGFTLTYNDYLVDPDALAQLRDLSAAARTKLNAFVADKNKVDAEGNPITLDMVFSEINATLSGEAGECLMTLQSTMEPEDSEDPCGLRFLYVQWATALGIIPEDEMGM